jgi:hypothetical protein
MTEPNGAPRYFEAIELGTLTANKRYRVYVSPEELVGVWAGKAVDDTQAMAMHGGLIGGLVGGLLAASAAKKRGQRAAELDSKSLEELRTDHKHNFAIPVNDIESAEITPSTFWIRINFASIKHVGLLRLSASGRKRKTLAILSNDDMHEAINLLTPPLGQSLRSGLAWDAERDKYRRA